MQPGVNVVVRGQSVHVGHQGREDLTLLFLGPTAAKHRLKPHSLFLGELPLLLVALDQMDVGLLSVPKMAHR